MDEEIKLFENLWKGGYFEGDPLDPVAVSGYGDLGYISVLHAVYQVCVKPYIGPEVVVLEIGPGRGTYTRTMLNAKEVWCLDALSAEHNSFWESVGNENQGKVRYIQVNDFSCSVLPDSHFDFIFSFGAFCHMTWEGQSAYFRNLFSKAKPGATGMVMTSDFDKFNIAMRNRSKLRTVRVSPEGLLRSMRFNLGVWRAHLNGQLEQRKDDLELLPGKWYHAGLKETNHLLSNVGWNVINPDVGVVPRDILVHFQKPTLPSSLDPQRGASRIPG